MSNSLQSNVHNVLWQCDRICSLLLFMARWPTPKVKVQKLAKYLYKKKQMKKICDSWNNRDILYFTTTSLILLQNLITSPLGPFVPASCCITASDHSTLYYHNQIKARRSKKEMTPVFTESNPDMLGTTTIPIASLQLLFTFLLFIQTFSFMRMHLSQV